MVQMPGQAINNKQKQEPILNFNSSRQARVQVQNQFHMATQGKASQNKPKQAKAKQSKSKKGKANPSSSIKEHKRGMNGTDFELELQLRSTQQQAAASSTKQQQAETSSSKQQQAAESTSLHA